ncbi:MAG: YtxH domain-containing protein [Ignavibacteriaceae bacterium]|nr:YtxH domain-containing protein [Ignavibacteriaceae bacterium]
MMARYDNYNRDNGGSMLAFFFGAVAGALAIILLDRDLRDKVEHKLHETKDKIRDKATEITEQVEGTAHQKLREAEDMIDERRNKREGEN